MATANLRYRKNGGSLLSAASTAVAEDVISLTATSFAGWTSGRFEIRTYPDGFACPAGWSTDAATGAYYYLSSSMTGTTPPDFTLPNAAAITAGQWGKFEFRLIVNGTIVSTATGVEIVGPNGTHDLAFGEGSEFGGATRSWVGPHQDNLRLFDTALAGGASASAPYVIDASVAVNASDVPLRAMTGTLAFFSSALPVSIGRSGVAASDVEAFRVRRTVTDGGGLGTSSTALRIALALPNGAGTETDVAEIGTQLTSTVGPVSKLVLRTMTGGVLADMFTLSGAGLVRLHGSAYASAGGRFVTDGSGNVTLAAISEAELRTAAAALTTSLNVNAQKITNLGTPTLATDAATKAYVDAISTGLDIKASVRVATTANITLSGPQTIDTVSVIAGDRVLVKDQSTGADRGIYLCAAGAWTRTTDFAAGSFAAGAFCFVEEGSANVDKGFVCTTNAGSDVVGTDSLAFTQFTGVGSGADATTRFLTDASSAINANDIPVRALASTLGIAGAANIVPLSLTFLAATGSGASGYSAEVRRALTSGVGTTGTWVGVKFTLPDYNTGADIAAATARVEATSGLGTTIVTKYVLAVSNGAGPVDMFTLAGSGAVRMHLYTAGRALFDGSGNITSSAITAAEVNAALSALSAGVVHSNGAGVLSSSLIVDADVDPAAAIAGSKIAPDFGSQNVTTTGSITAGTNGFVGPKWDRATAGALTLGGTNATSVAVSGLPLTGVLSVDNSGGTLAIGANTVSQSFGKAATTASFPGLVSVTGTAAASSFIGAGLDTSGASTLTLGGTNANAITVSRAGITTTIAGALAVTEATTHSALVTITLSALGTTKTRGLEIGNDTVSGSQVSAQIGQHAFHSGGTRQNMGFQVEAAGSARVTQTWYYGTGTSVPASQIFQLDSSDTNFGSMAQADAFVIRTGNYTGFRFNDSANRGGLSQDNSNNALVLKSYNTKNLRLETGADSGGSGGVIRMFWTGGGLGRAVFVPDTPGSTAAALTIDLSKSQNSEHAVTEATTVTISGGTPGQSGTIVFKQDGTGRTITMPGNGSGVEYDAAILALTVTGIVDATAGYRTVLSYYVLNDVSGRVYIYNRSISQIP